MYECINIYGDGTSKTLGLLGINSDLYIGAHLSITNRNRADQNEKY